MQVSNGCVGKAPCFPDLSIKSMSHEKVSINTADTLKLHSTILTFACDRHLFIIRTAPTSSKFNSCTILTTYPQVR